MPCPASTYIQQLRALQADLGIVMTAWSSDASFEKAKVIAEAAAPLIAGEIGRLQNAQIKLNPSAPMTLRTKLEQLHALMTKEEKRKFEEYSAMLDSLINEDV